MAETTQSGNLRGNPSKGRTELVWEGKHTQVERIPLEVRDKVKKWSDYIDYWAVDWYFKDDTFHNQWQSYRTRKHSTLATESDWHNYPGAGTYKLLVKIVDIFDNDTTKLLEVKL